MDNSKEVYEFLRNLLSTIRGHVKLLCGSAFELPIKYVLANATDVDIMYIPTNICALPPNVSAPHAFQGKTLVVNTEGVQPGFARLYSPDCKRLYCKQAIILENHFAMGPAWTTLIAFSKHSDIINSIGEHLGSYLFSLHKRILEMKIDRVIAIHCPSWPSEADDWKTRERPSGWPSKEVMHQVVASGCHFVAKPHQSSPEDDTQWRFSFSQAELILIHSWTDMQKHIYHILRLIKSEVVKACGRSDEAVLCTYFFKTLMLWECERKPKEFWNAENLEMSVGVLLCTIIEWLIDGCCPNYFIPKNNMIGAANEKVDFSKEIQLLLIYTTSRILLTSTIWPKPCSNNMIGLMHLVIPNKFLHHVNLILVRDNFLNPLYPKTKARILKQLTAKNSILWCQASDLYSGIFSHLQFMKTRCPIRRYVMKREALGYFQSSLKEIGGEYSKRYLSIDESIYDCLERFRRSTDCSSESRRMPENPLCEDSCEMHVRDYCSHAPLNSSRNFNLITHGQFLRYHTRQVESEADDMENKIAYYSSTDYVNASIENILQTFVTSLGDHVTTSTYFISLAYLANFYYTALQDFTKTSALCDTVITFPEGCVKGLKSDTSFYERAFPICITNELSTIFDEHFQIVLGLITLHRYVDDSLRDNSAVLIRICPAQLLMYLNIQCKRREGVNKPHEVPENYKDKHPVKEWMDTYFPLSEAFMSAVLHASHRKY